MPCLLRHGWTLLFDYARVAGVKITELKMVPKNKMGMIKNDGVRIEPHEYDTALFLTNYGFRIEVIRPINIPKTKSPDFLIAGALWESKSPVGSGKSTIPRQFHRSKKQANRMILDLRRINLSAKIAETEATRCFRAARNIDCLLLITKDKRLLDIKR